MPRAIGGLLLALTLAATSGCIVREGDASTASDTMVSTELPDATAVLQGGVAAFHVQGEAEKVEVEVVSVEGQPFDEALQARVKEAAASEWSVQVQAKTVQAVKKGDALLATFFARVTDELEAGGGETQFVFELAHEPWSKSVSYSVRLTTEWRKIQIPFVSAEDYASGDAQMIFRLGYEPETIQIGGVTVENYGSEVAVVRLPNTKAADQKLASQVVIAPKLEPVKAGELAFTIDPTQVTGTISPYVYGINSQNIADTGATVRRNGGNRGTVYNWEINASNAGKDWKHVNDDWPCTTLGYKDCDRPAAQFVNFAKENKAGGAETVVTVPVLDYVSADKNQTVTEEQTAPSSRFHKSLPRKPGPLSATPDTTDGFVYQNEFVHHLVQRFGKASEGGIKFYSLDNEPALWNETHPRIHPEPATYEEVARRTEATASAILDVDPTATVLGGIMFGWSEYMSLSDAADSDKYNATYGNYVEYFLAQAQLAEQKHEQRLVHALDIHWYPEARGTKRITDEDASRKTIDARLQAPRSLWDPNYLEKSWITANTKEPIRLIPWFKEMIEKRYPGTKLAMTEYNFGATQHVSGGLAQVDVLGVFGREGMFLANYWGKGAGVGQLPPYVAAAFKLYRNYDGNGGKFGDTAVVATVADVDATSVYAAKDSTQPNRLTIVVINKHQQNIYDAVFSLGDGAPYTKAKTFVIDDSAAEVKPGPDVAVSGGTLHHPLQPLSATLFVCE